MSWRRIAVCFVLSALLSIAWGVHDRWSWMWWYGFVVLWLWLIGAVSVVVWIWQSIKEALYEREER